MTTSDYNKYCAAVERFLVTNLVVPGCHGPVESEGYFSWRPCECCGSRLGGNRERYQFASGTSPQASELFEAEICTDCVQFLAYGQLDDMTMAEIVEG